MKTKVINFKQLNEYIKEIQLYKEKYNYNNFNPEQKKLLDRHISGEDVTSEILTLLENKIKNSEHGIAWSKHLANEVKKDILKNKRNELQAKLEKKLKQKKPNNTNTVIIYKGKSPKNNQPITAILSGLDTPSKNTKTGPMAQIDILLEDIHPWEAIKTGQDEAICGECPMRPSQKNIDSENVDLNIRWNHSGDPAMLPFEVKCYVNTMHGPASKFKAMKRGAYLQLEPLAVGQILKARNLSVRFGSYGDPAMIPFEVIDTIIKTAGTTYTSYTHQYMQPWFDSRHLIYSMASVDHINTVEKLQAIHPTARYYKIADDYNNLASDEIACPSDKNKTDIFGNRLVTCSNCGLCSGTKKQAKNIVIIEIENKTPKTKKTNWIEEFTKTATEVNV